MQTVDEFAVVAARIVGRVRADDLGALHLRNDAMFLLQKCAEQNLGDAQSLQLCHDVHLVVVTLLSFLQKAALLEPTKRLFDFFGKAYGAPLTYCLHQLFFLVLHYVELRPVLEHVHDD